MAKRSNNGGSGDEGGGLEPAQEAGVTPLGAEPTGQEEQAVAEGTPAVGVIPASQANEGEVRGDGPVVRNEEGQPVNVSPEFVRPKEYTAGERSTRTIYGAIAPDGSITPLDGEPEPGTRAVVLAQEGDAISVQAAGLLNGQGGAGQG